MYEYSKVRRHCSFVSFLFARLGALLGFGNGYPEVGSFVSESSALGLILYDLSPLLCQSLNWFKFVRAMSMEVRSSEFDTSLSSSDKAVEVDIAISASLSLNPSSSSPTVLRAFHALKEVCSLDEDTIFRFSDRFQIPDKTRIRLPHPGEKAYAFNIGEVCFYEVALLSSLRFPVHPFIMELLHHLGIALGQLMSNSWRIVISLMEIWMIVMEGDVIRMDELLHLYCLKESKEFGYYELVPWDRKSRLIVSLPLSFCYWKSRYFFVSGDGWETLSDDLWGDVPRLLRRWGTPTLGASSFIFVLCFLFFF